MPGTVATGHRLSTEEGSGVVSFADVAGGMLEMAQKREELKWKGVSVLATGDVVTDWGPNMKYLLAGMVAYCSPMLWRLGRRWGRW